MTIKNDLRAGRHCVSKMHIHLVFVSKYRGKVFSKKTLQTMEKLFANTCRDFESQLVEFDGESDHVHLLIEYPPKVAVAKLVNGLKGVSSRKLKQFHPELEKRYYKGALWSPSYFAGSCGGAPIEIVRQYIEQQNTPM